MATDLQHALERFRRSYFYRDEAVLIDEIVSMDPESLLLEARLDTCRPLPFADLQRVREGHPRHVAGGDLVMTTAALGSLHAWLFHDLRWEDGWVGYGNRIHRVDFHRLVHTGPPLELSCRETRSRKSSRRLVARYRFDFRQEGETAYFGEQTAMFLREDLARERGHRRGIDDPRGGA